MLITYKQHAVKRCDLPWDTSHLKFATKDQLSQCVRVCQYCYLLLTTELDLMEVTATQTERTLAHMMSIPYREQTLTEDPMIAIQLQFLPKQLMQWRFLCLLECFSSPTALPTGGLYLSMKFCDFVTTFPVETMQTQLNCMKVNYLYHQLHRTPKQFFTSFVAEVRLTQGPDWKHWLAKSSIQMLKDFPDDLKNNQALVQSMHSIMFDRKQEPVATLSLKAGVSSDYPVNTQNIKSIMNKEAEMYLPEPSYTTTDPLPTAWMELFGVYDEQVSVDDVAEKEIYVPTLTHAEMLRMEDITSPMKKLKRMPLDPDHVPSHRCCSAHNRSSSKLRSRVRTPIKNATGKVPTLDLGSLLDTTGVEVKKLHMTVCDYLQRRPTPNISTRSVSVLKRPLTDRTGASTQRTSFEASIVSSRVTPNTRKAAFSRRIGLIKKYAGAMP